MTLAISVLLAIMCVYNVFLRLKIRYQNHLVINSEHVCVERKSYDDFVKFWRRRSGQYRRRERIIRKLITDNKTMKKELEQIDFLQRCLSTMMTMGR